VDTTTSLTLLEGLRDPANQDAWQRFFDRYQPIVIGFAIKLGLTDADAQDASQNTMVSFVEAYRQGAYDRRKGRLRSWLFGIACRKVKDIQRARRNELVMVDQPNATRFLATVQEHPCGLRSGSTQDA
jgi:DNA-directed RNA polymerase specialized sigma24 family protein